ncbi:MAG: hypothetical protein M0006_10195 [Magnetospirillum sp.]|nr:hypothetical protein [Magnetospirillum sp.]
MNRNALIKRLAALDLVAPTDVRSKAERDQAAFQWIAHLEAMPQAERQAVIDEFVKPLDERRRAAVRAAIGHLGEV